MNIAGIGSTTTYQYPPAGLRTIEPGNSRKSIDPQKQLGDWYSRMAAQGTDVEVVQARLDQRGQFVRMVKAAEVQGAFGEPKAFLQRLSAEQLAVLQQMQSLVDPVTPAQLEQLSDEEVANLLTIPDIGLNSQDAPDLSGFADSDDKERGMQAWNSAAEGLSDAELRLIGGGLMVHLAEANIRYDQQGNATGFLKAGETGYRNPLIQPDLSLSNLAEQMKQRVEHQRGMMNEEHYQMAFRFWSQFQQQL